MPEAIFFTHGGNFASRQINHTDDCAL